MKLQEINEERNKIEHEIFELKNKLNKLVPALSFKFLAYDNDDKAIHYNVHDLLYEGFEAPDDIANAKRHTKYGYVQGYDLFEGQCLDTYDEDGDGHDTIEAVIVESDYPLEMLRVVKYFQPCTKYDYVDLHIHLESVTYSSERKEFAVPRKDDKGKWIDDIVPYFDITSKVPYKSEDWYKMNELCTGFEGLKLVHEMFINYKTDNNNENDKREDSSQERNGHE